MDSHVRSTLKKRAQSAIIQYAIFRWESAVTVAGTILLTALWPRPFPWWPIWGWPLLGLLGVAAIFYSSITDPQTNARVLRELLLEHYNPRRIQDAALRKSVEAALEYQQSIEALVRRQRSGPLRERLEHTADQLGDWVGNIYRLAMQLDLYRADEILARDRARVPMEIRTLSNRRKQENDPLVRQELGEVLESKEKQWQTLQALDAQMKQAELQMEQSLTALATVYSQIQLIGAQGFDSSRSERLQEDIQEQIKRLDDLVTSIREVYRYSSES